MTMLVSLDQALLHLRIDTDTAGAADESDIRLKIMGASAAVLNYIGRDQMFLDTYGDPLDDSSGDPIVPADVQAATLLLLGDLYRNRDGENTAEWEYGFLPRSCQALLFPRRLPTLA